MKMVEKVALVVHADGPSHENAYYRIAALENRRTILTTHVTPEYHTVTGRAGFRAVIEYRNHRRNEVLWYESMEQLVGSIYMKSVYCLEKEKSELVEEITRISWFPLKNGLL